MDLFAANGFDGVSIADIAAAAGVSQGALYRHYRAKKNSPGRCSRPPICAPARSSIGSAPARRVRGRGDGNDRAFLRALRRRFGIVPLHADHTARLSAACSKRLPHSGRCHRRSRRRRCCEKTTEAHRSGVGRRRHHGCHSAVRHLPYLRASQRICGRSSASVGARRDRRGHGPCSVTRRRFQKRVDSQMATREPVLTTALIRS